MENQEDADEGKIVYDWSPPTGKKQNFYYKGAPIDREHVIFIFFLHLYLHHLTSLF